MKSLLTLLLLTLYLGLNAQTVVQERVSDLMPELYNITGQAFLEELSNGDLQLRLSDDFDTPSGPDVRIFLSNSVSVSNGVEVADLSALGHFDGALTVDVPSNVAIDDYDFIVFFCFAFNQLWASGEFGPVTGGGGGGPVCNSSSILNVGASNFIDICPSDNQSNIVQFANTLGISAGPEYAYLITDQNEILQEVVLADQYDFEGSTDATQRVYGMHYSGTLTPIIGNDRIFTTADGCFEHSSNTGFIQVTKNACINCDESTISIAGGNQAVDICPSDSESDIVQFENSLDLNAGSEYAYLITDENEILETVVLEDEYDFEGSVTATQRVYGLHYNGALDSEIGQIRTATTASGCFEHSSDTDFITITKNACFVCEPNTVSLANGNSSDDICPTDGNSDIITFQNSLGLSAGTNYVYLLTSQSQILQEVIAADQYDFEASALNTQRVYGLHFDGTLNAAVGMPRTATTASGCFEHSSNTDFITITKDACFVCEPNNVSLANGNTISDICPSDNNSDVFTFQNSLGISAGTNYVYLLTDQNETLQEVISADSYDFEGTDLNTQRVYGLHFDGTLSPAVGMNRTATTASGCFEHSSDTDFITITKNACFVCEPNAVSLANGNSSNDICPTDNSSNLIALQNSLGLNAGANYVYLLTDENEILQEVISTDSYDFEGTDLNTQRVYGLHFDGTLSPALGMDRNATTASGCFDHSSDTDFITITKNACFVCEPNAVSLANGSSSNDICPTDNNSDLINLQNSLGLNAGANYVYLLTDENEILQEVISADSYDFEGTDLNTQRVYGLHFDGTLSPALGMDRTATTASGCFEHSSDTDFITITKNACFVCEPNAVSLANGSSSNDICPTDNNSDLINLQNSLGLNAGANYVYLLTDENEILQEVISTDSYDFEGTDLNTQRVYGLHFDGTLNAAIGFVRVATTATGCFEHSSETEFISITKNACFVCESSTVSNASGSNSLNICPSDNNDDNISFTNSLGLDAGSNYVYLITDENEILQEVVNTNQFNFEGTSPNSQRVYGMHFDGNLNPAIGQNRTATTADGCFQHSDSNQFISIAKNACFDCNQSTVSATNGNNPLEICQNDNEANIIQFTNSLGLSAGNEYVYLLTDENEILQEVINADQYDFEGSSANTQRVYGMHFDGQLNPAIGQNRTATTADGCFEHSLPTQFIEVIKNACFICNSSTVANANGSNQIDICPSDNNSDVIQLENSLGLNAGNNYIYLLTDENQILLEVINDDEFDFEGSSATTQRIYGMHFDGQLNPAIGSDRMATTADGCFEHSDNSQFISISKNACFECIENSVSNANGSNALDICPSDGDNDIVQLQNSLGLSAGSNYVYLLTDENEILIEVIIDDEFDFEGSSLEVQRIYGLHFDGVLNSAIGLNRLATTASRCFEHSDDTEFISVSKNACFDCNANTVSNANGSNTLDICPSDNDNDIVQLQNSLGLSAGNNYVYLLTDENEILLEVINTDQYNFEGSSDEPQRIYGMHFDGQLNPAIGSDRRMTTASECFEHSADTQFISVSKNACFVCNTNTISNANGNNALDICPRDGDNDIVQLQNSLGLSAGNNYVYLLTDEDEILIEVINDDQYNFEGTNEETQRIYGLHFDGQLIPAIGSNRRMTTASRCFEHSEDTAFISVSKNACFECNDSSVSTANGDNAIDICPSDGEDDIVQLQNSLGLNTGNNYVYLLTDENEILIEVINDDQYNFEGSGDDTQRMYGLHFDGALAPVIGSNRRMTTADGCFEHSNNDAFIAITKGACEEPFECLPSFTASTDWIAEVDICPDDGMNDWIEIRNNLFVEPGENYVYLVTDAEENLLELVFEGMINFEGSGADEQRVYGMHYAGSLDPAIGENRLMTTASDCFTHSGEDFFLTITKNGCPGIECLDNFTATTDWASEVVICPTDGEDDILELRNNIGVAAGENYVYLLTDAQEILQEVIVAESYNFEGSTEAEQRVYGLHYDGTLQAIIGENRMMTTSTGCFTHSGEDFFLTITKGACIDEFECMESLTATTDWATEIDICPNDGVSDLTELRNNLFIAPGDNYVYLLTDAQGILQEVIATDMYDFEGSTAEEQRIYGLHFSGTLSPAIGEDRLMTTASGCFIHSGDNLFLTITKNACEDEFECSESLTATHNWVTEIDICAIDGADDNVFLQNNIFTPPGENYVFLLTDEFEVLQEVIIDTVYNFENTGTEEQRVYGLSYSGTLTPQIGENRKNTTASGCFIHSGDNLFIRINKTAACAPSAAVDTELLNSISVFPNPSSGRINIDLSATDTSFDAVSLFDIHGKKIQEIGKATSFEVGTAGVYLLRFTNKEGSVTKRIVIQ